MRKEIPYIKNDIYLDHVEFTSLKEAMRHVQTITKRSENQNYVLDEPVLIYANNEPYRVFDSTFKACEWLNHKLDGWSPNWSDSVSPILHYTMIRFMYYHHYLKSAPEGKHFRGKWYRNEEYPEEHKRYIVMYN